jgi:carboxymethylenebutenolidase
MHSEMIDVTTQDGVADAYLARPDDQRAPAVLLVMDAYGLRPQIERMADQERARAHVVVTKGRARRGFLRFGRVQPA